MFGMPFFTDKFLLGVLSDLYLGLISEDEANV